MVSSQEKKQFTQITIAIATLRFKVKGFWGSPQLVRLKLSPLAP